MPSVPCSRFSRQEFQAACFFRQISLRQYLNKLSKRRKLHIPPIHPQDLLDISVPLKTSDNTKTRLAIEAVAGNRRLLVTGKPGAGKSVLLRYLALKYARPGTTEVFPVFVQLEKENQPDLPLFQHICNEFSLRSFREPNTFAIQQLEKGRLLLLLGFGFGCFSTRFLTSFSDLLCRGIRQVRCSALLG